MIVKPKFTNPPIPDSSRSKFDVLQVDDDLLTLGPSSSDLAGLRSWVGRSETRHDQIGAQPLLALAATLDLAAAAMPVGTPLPPLWHWLFFLPLHRQSELGPDGHAARGGFLPPVPLPRRMWAGSQFEFHRALRVGDAVKRISTIDDVSVKQGRSGPLVFVKVRHELHLESSSDGTHRPAIVELHDIVYRDARRPDDAEPPSQPAPADAHWQRQIVADDVLLFRYSALTFNGHRIHYDRRYATEVELYPGLVVHGPLIATLLLDLLRREMPAAEVVGFRFKALRPTFDGQPFKVCGAVESAEGAGGGAAVEPAGRRVRLWAQDEHGALAMDAVATLKV